ncbi:class I SAM-dependent methyltransferase [Candidatus Darwinibacter acetoxidans]
MQEYDELAQLLGELLPRGALLRAVLSKRRRKSIPYERVSLRPLELRGRLHYQAAYHLGDKVQHRNLLPGEAGELICGLLQDDFRQALLCTEEADYQVLLGKKGGGKILRQPPSQRRAEANLAHDRPKRYILQEGTPYPFLVELGVMNSAGRVLAKRYHKFRQLNKYLEIVEDCLPHLQPRDGGVLNVVDFGSGRAYLTFALYHYLVEELQLPVRLTGLDLKEDVVAFCSEMAKKLGYKHLEFVCADIRDFAAEGQVDLVVSLHACDVATDFALAQAVRWGARVILAVPCCQHEIFTQLQKGTQSVLLQHGILKERTAALLTDAARGKLLEMQGYAVQIMEFIDLEHTPKNLLIRAFRGGHQKRGQAAREYAEFKEYWGIKPTLEVLLAEGNGHAQVEPGSK